MKWVEGTREKLIPWIFKSANYAERELTWPEHTTLAHLEAGSAAKPAIPLQQFLGSSRLITNAASRLLMLCRLIKQLPSRNP